MSDKPIVSVIIPNLNSPIIDKAVQSILDQITDIEFEIIVVGQDAYNRVPSGPNIKFMQTKDTTPPGIARNIGVKKSKGKIIIFMDADCICAIDFLKQHIAAHKSDTPKLICGSVTFQKDKYWSLCDNLSTFHEYLPNISPGRRKILPALNLSLTRSSWDQIGEFNSNVAAEDADFSYRAAIKNITPFFYPSAIIYHQPRRSTFDAIVHHAYNFGKYSLQINPIYRENIIFTLIREPFTIRLLSPIIAMFIIFKMVILEKLSFKYWHTLPIVYLLKICWCFGAAVGINKYQENERQIN
jgi:glycosyltransferase involved in cell wall biosynthesis